MDAAQISGLYGKNNKNKKNKNNHDKVCNHDKEKKKVVENQNKWAERFKKLLLAVRLNNRGSSPKSACNK